MDRVRIFAILQKFCCLYWTFFFLRCLSEQQCFKLTLFWCEINEHFSIVQPNHLASVHVKIVLRILYDQLSDACKLKFASDQRTLSNQKLVATLGLQRIKCEYTEVTDIHTKCDDLVKDFLAERSDSSLYKLVSLSVLLRREGDAFNIY